MLHDRSSGFTLVELLVVIAIIGLLATVGVVSLSSARAKARDAKRLSDVNQIAKVLELYQSGKTEYPVGDKEPTIRVMDGGCISEGGGIAATCTGVALLNPIASSPNNASGERYRYKAYQEEVPPAGGATACDTDDATQTCSSFGIQFDLETSVSGVTRGVHCMTNRGLFGDPATANGCPAAN